MEPKAETERPVTCSAGERLLALALLVAVVASSYLPLRPPRADAVDFPTAEAEVLLAELAKAPRPLGTEEHRRVGRLIEQRIRVAGLEPVVQEEVVSLPLGWGGIVRVARVRNLLARLPGTDSTGTVLLTAHYDSVQSSPGAADDGAGVVALLATLDELAAGPPPANDLVFLFTDGEEPGLLGARAFAEHHRWMDDVALVINFEARGVEGPSLMFETGPGTGELVADYARAALHPVAASYSHDVYRHLPNDTDLSVFKDAGLPGFNFAFIGGSRRYHSQLDTVDALDRRSLAHHGANALRLARHFGDADLSAGDWGAPRTYFNLPLAGLVVHPNPLSLLAAAAALLLAGWFAVRQLRAGRFTVRRLLAAFAAVLAALALPALLALIADLLVLELAALNIEHFGDAGGYLAGLVLLAAGVAALVLLWAVRRFGWRATAAAALLAAALGALVMALTLSSSSYLLAWPALGGVLAAWLVDRRGAGRRGTCLLAGLGGLPVLLLWPPALALVGEAFGLGEGILIALLAALAVALLVVPLALLAADRAGRWAAAGLAAAGLAVVVATSLGAGHGPGRPQETSLLYLLDAEEGEAWWATMQVPVDPWAAQVLGGEAEDRPLHRFLGGNAQATMAPAPELDLAAPRVELVEDAEADGGGRRYRLRAVSPRGAPVLRLELESEEPLARLRIGGREVPLGSEEEAADWYLLLYAFPPSGAEVEVETGGDAPLTVTLADQGYDLEALPGVPPRGESRIASRVIPTDLTVVRGGSWTLGGGSALP